MYYIELLGIRNIWIGEILELIWREEDLNGKTGVEMFEISTKILKIRIEIHKISIKITKIWRRVVVLGVCTLIQIYTKGLN